MKKKKVVHIVEAFGGGIFTYLVDLIKEIDNEFEITIIYAQREQTPKNFEQYFNENVKFIKSKYLQRNIKLSNEIKAVIEIRKILKEIKPDIVHLHSSKAGIIGRIAVNDKNTNIIYNPHGFSFLMQNLSRLKKAIYWSIEKLATLRKPTIVGCSKGEYEEALKLSKNSICINNGINVEKLEEATNKLVSRKLNVKNLKVCTIGRIDFQKNPKMFNNIASNLPEVKFTWIGDGDLKQELTSKNIVITGWKTREEVLEILNEHDVFILTSLWEGLPIALLEAMYMKKICIVSNVIGNRDVIINNENGFIAYSDQYTDIINSLENYNLDEIANNARKDVILNYNWEKNAKNYIDLYKKGRKI